MTPWPPPTPAEYDGRIVLIQGLIDRLVKDFALVLRGVVVYPVPGVPGTVCSGGLAGFRGRGCRGEGVLRVGGVIFERRSPSCRILNCRVTTLHIPPLGDTSPRKPRPLPSMMALGVPPERCVLLVTDVGAAGDSIGAHLMRRFGDSAPDTPCRCTPGVVGYPVRCGACLGTKPPSW